MAVSNASQDLARNMASGSSRSEIACELKTLFAAQGAKRWQIARTDAKTRVEKLTRLRAAIIARQDELYEALWKDYRKSSTEAWLTEVMTSAEEIDHTVAHLRSWMRDKKAKGAFILPLARSYLRYEPKGRVLIMAPWNYPFHLLIAPLVSAIAAGNVVIAKPSNKTPQRRRFSPRSSAGSSPGTRWPWWKDRAPWSASSSWSFPSITCFSPAAPRSARASVKQRRACTPGSPWSSAASRPSSS